MRRLAVVLAVVGAFALPAAAGTAPPCAKRFTVAQTQRAIDVVYGGTRDVPASSRAMLRRIVRCQRNPGARGFVRGYWRREIAEWQYARMPSALASVYDAAGGPIACGGDSYAMGVANRTLPCGTKLRICYVRCINAVVFDRGPYVYPREFDLSRAVQYATGFPDGVAAVKYSIR